MERPFDVPDHGLVCDMLWSDPDEVMYANYNFESSMLPCGTNTGAYNSHNYVFTVKTLYTCTDTLYNSKILYTVRSIFTNVLV